MEITIVKASIQDIPKIQHIAYESWPVAYTHIVGKEQIDFMLKLIYSKEALLKQFEENHHFIMANENETTLAFASYNLITSPGIYKLQKLYALPMQQGKGIGKKLIEFIIEDIKQRGAVSLQLNVNRKNKAISFYEHIGFKIIRQEDIAIGNGFFMNDYVMEKSCL